ncbi:MAG: hypothetical protein QOG80_2 [Pseudonocardiales bacterium]|nr:hypothetical protein [Pseudonocardiales bacterium]
MEFLRFALLGVATGGLYALLSQSLVLIYRGSGLLNFAQGATAMFGAYAYYDLTVRHGVPKALAAVFALILCGLLGAVIHLVVLRSMRHAAPLSRVIATLGIVLVLQSAAFLRYGHNPLQVPSLLPTGTVQLTHSLPIGADRIWIFGIAVALSAVLWSTYRYSRFGRATTAVAENGVAAASFGISADVVGALNWAIGSMAAGLAGILIAPIIYLEPTSLVLLVIPAMSAALIGEFVSFPITFFTALALGVAESEMQRYVNQPGWATAVPYLVVVLVLVARGRALPLRSFILDRLPSVGTGRVRPPVVFALWAGAIWFALSTDANWSDALVTTFGSAIVCLSVVVLTGYTGQLSLAQYVLAGIGALIAARLVQHMPFLLAAMLAVLVTAVIGALVGLPALRTRGVSLAVATLGLAGGLVAVVIGNPKYTGGISGITIPVPNLFGWSLDPFLHPDRYAVVTISVFMLLALAVANVRRGVTGRRMLAVRSNERAAAAMGVNVAWVKTYAFMLAAAIAAAGGVMLAFIQPSIQLNTFDVFTCILVVAVTVTGGVGNVPGAFLGSLMISGGIVSRLLHGWSQINDYLPLIGGLLLVATLVSGPDGVFELNRRAGALALAPLLARLPRRARRPHVLDAAPSIERVVPRTLQVTGVSVAFGGVQAVRGVSLDVRPGEVHGLIGPNGAGKTTLIDAITGFARTTDGTVAIGDVDISRWPARRRAGAGVARSFQSLELFADLTIRENLAVAGERPTGLSYLRDIVRPRPIRLSDTALEAVHQFDLVEHIDSRPTEVSFGVRKTVAIARAVAGAPSVLLLDEPAAGLDDHEITELAALIRHLADAWGVAVLLVEHKVDMIMSISDRVTVLDAGQVLASGSPDEVSRDPLVIDAYLGTINELPTADHVAETTAGARLGAVGTGGTGGAVGAISPALTTTERTS